MIISSQSNQPDLHHPGQITIIDKPLFKEENITRYDNLSKISTIIHEAEQKEKMRRILLGHGDCLVVCFKNRINIRKLG